ncbi:hypothetical protein BQ8769_175 [Escherichia coli]|uniref:Uncharacterized protein n=1 Tax=Escherichia coli TaxID=562 RepID=A0A1W1EMI0_ECOLX|nr:hypothetical protein BQ8769_175 [Escherichia coli]
MIWQPEFTDKTLSRKPGAVQHLISRQGLYLKLTLHFKRHLLSGISGGQLTK